MKDQYGRAITYLRLSVTDLCNLRCLYCMPEHGIEKRPHHEILSIEELIEIARAAVACGVRKIRLTGGEPLVRRGILDICRGIAALPGLEELCLTTNAILLGQQARELKEAGVTRLNISLDTLDPDSYAKVTRLGRLDTALEGLEAARAVGFRRSKINAVLMGGINDRDVKQMVELTRDEDLQIRFIELMPMGECAHWDKGRFLPGDYVLEQVPALQPLGAGGVARLYQVPGWKGTVGLISPISSHFCGDCNRIRVTSDGKLKPCLHSREEINLRGLSGAELEEAIRCATFTKPRQHHLDDQSPSESLRAMNEIGG